MIPNDVGLDSGAATIPITESEILYSLDEPAHSILAGVGLVDRDAHRAQPVRRPVHREPEFGVTSAVCGFADPPARSKERR